MFLALVGVIVAIVVPTVVLPTVIFPPATPQLDDHGALPAVSVDGTLVAALFHDGLSTRAEVSETSGRGVGMAAVRAACVETGGTIAIESAIGVGTRFRFTWPAPGRVTSRPMLVLHSR